ncbi:MAG: hypothetical protein JW874_03250, partial [Spirochaetales bacterium]|nr:hypothetical protein [Spirochaetales bacterium]
MKCIKATAILLILAGIFLFEACEPKEKPQTVEYTYTGPGDQIIEVPDDAGNYLALTLNLGSVPKE